jgi:hypothetical protein
MAKLLKRPVVTSKLELQISFLKQLINWSVQKLSY